MIFLSFFLFFGGCLQKTLLTNTVSINVIIFVKCVAVLLLIGNLALGYMSRKCWMVSKRARIESRSSSRWKTFLAVF